MIFVLNGLASFIGMPHASNALYVLIQWLPVDSIAAWYLRYLLHFSRARGAGLSALDGAGEARGAAGGYS